MTSIRRRILFPLVPLIGLALLVAGFGAERAVTHELVEALDRSLLVLARSVGAAVDVELGGELEFELEGMPVLEFHDPESRSFFRVADDAGEILFQSGSATDLTRVHSEVGPAYTYHHQSGVRYRVCTVPVMRAPEDDEEDRAEWQEAHPGEPRPEPEPRRFWVTMGQPTAAVDAALTALRFQLVLGFSVLFLVLILLPLWIVTRALHPLLTLSQQANQVGPRTPSRRLDELGVDREVRSLVRALNLALDRLADAYARQQRFTADAAHELRTPLTTLRTHCEVTLRRERSAAELRDTLESVHRTVLRMTDLVQDLLALSRLQAESRLTEVGTVDLTAVVREAVSLHLPAAEGADVHLVQELVQPVSVPGHPGLLTECVSNLVENAVRHTPAGGTVTVSVLDGDEPRVRVRDTGDGIAEEHLRRIFDRFYRVDGDRSRGRGGTGLGLALAAEIARVHGGSIEVESRPGAGSCFTLHLPRTGHDEAL